MFQSLPHWFWSSLLLKQRNKILLFCGSCDLEITSSKNDSTIKTSVLWLWRLDSLNDIQRVGLFTLKYQLKNLLILAVRLLSTLFRSALIRKKLHQKYKKKILWNSRSGHFKLPFDKTTLVNKNMFRFNKTTLKCTTKNVYSRLLCWLWSLVY